MQIIVKNKALDEWLQNVALAWRAKFPQRAAMYEVLLKERASTLVNPSGMSADGTLKYTAEVPQELFHVIENKIPGFFRDMKCVRKFQEAFMGDLAPKSKPHSFFIEQKKE